MFKIQRSESGQRVVLTLSGRVTAEHTSELQRLIDIEGGRAVILDLNDVALVDRDVVIFLAHAEARGVRLKNCPGYVREWIGTEGTPT